MSTTPVHMRGHGGHTKTPCRLRAHGVFDLIGQNQVSADPDAAPVSDHAVTMGRMDEITLTTTQLARLAEGTTRRPPPGRSRAGGACRNDSIIQSRQGAIFWP